MSIATLPDIFGTLKTYGSFDTLLCLIETSNTRKLLQGLEQLTTLLAPDDAAFDKMPSYMLTSLMKDFERMEQLLNHHCITGVYPIRDLGHMHSIKTIEGDRLEIPSLFGERIGEANITNANIECENGMIHIIDRVLIPLGTSEFHAE